MDDVSIRLKLIDDVSQGLTRLEQRLKEIQRQNSEQAKRSAQEQAQASNQSNQQQLSGFQRLVQRERELREQAAQRAAQLAQEQAQASNQANQQQLSGFQRMVQRERELREQAAQRARQLAQEQTRLAEQAARHEQEATQRALQAINNARQQLGVRSHAQINAEMSHIQAAYRTLAQSGTLSFREQAQAADKLRQHLTQLTNEMGNLTAAQKRYGALQTGVGVAGAVVGGVVGTGYAMVEPIKDAMQYDDRLTNMTNVGFSERDTFGRREGKKEIQTAIEKAVKDSGGLVDTFGAAQMLDQLMAGGRVPVKQAMSMLPYLTQVAGANAADPLDIARTTNAAYGLNVVKTNDDLAKFWNMSVAAGQASSFELKDQVKFLPEQLAFAKANGSHGLDAAREVLKLNVTSSSVTGNSDEAGVATSNFLRKQTGSDTQKDFTDYVEQRYGTKGADLIKSMDKSIAKGGNASQFWAEFIKHETDKNPNVMALRKQLETEKDLAKREMLNSRVDLRKGEIINELFQDVRAVKGVLGSLNTEYGDSVDAKLKEAQAGKFRPNEENMAFKREQVTAKTTDLGNTVDIQKHHELQKTFDGIGNAAQKANALAGEHSALASVVAFAPQIGTGLGAAGAGWMGARWIASRAAPAIAESAAVASPSLAANASVAFSRLTSSISNLTARATGIIGQTPQILTNLSSKATGVISNATRVAAPYAQAAAPWIAKAAGVVGAGYTGWQIGSAANPYINKALSTTKRDNTLGGKIYDFFNDDKANKLATGAAIPRASTTATALGGKEPNGGAASALTAAIAKLTGNESGLSSAISNLMSWQPNPLPVEVNTQSHLTVSLAAGLVAQAQSSQSNSTAQKGSNSSAVSTGNIWSGAPS